MDEDLPDATLAKEFYMNYEMKEILGKWVYSFLVIFIIIIYKFYFILQKNTLFSPKQQIWNCDVRLIHYFYSLFYGQI